MTGVEAEEQHPLRDLADKIKEVTNNHACSNQACEIVAVCTGHLNALALIYELHEKDLRLNKAGRQC